VSVLVSKVGSHWGLGIRVCLGESSSDTGDLCQDVCLQKETKKGRNGQQGILAVNVLAERDKERQEWAVISAWGLLS
jgi:hypothetical protein